jgi:hypothetical protein
VVQLACTAACPPHMSDKCSLRVYLSDKKEAFNQSTLASAETTMQVLVTGATDEVKRRPVERLTRTCVDGAHTRRKRATRQVSRLNTRQAGSLHVLRTKEETT